MKLSLRTAGRIAWRETRSSMTKFVFVVLAVAMGVGALSGVRGFSQSVRTMLGSETRTIMAADLTARQFQEPTDQQATLLQGLAKRGIDQTVITETVSMAASQVADAVPVLVSIKAVDPAKYPYYGSVKLSPEMPLGEALKAETVIAGEDVLIRLGVKPGETIRLGSQDFRVAAIVVSEPDRMSGSLNVGLRIMLSREAFARTGLMQIGSRAAQRYLFKLEPGGANVEQARALITEALPNALVADSTQAHPLITRGVERATIFLSLVSLIALIVGAIGVGMAMYAHLQQKMDNIAVMKSLGATSGEIIRIFALQTLMLGFLGGAAGVIVGRAIEEVFPALVSQLFEIKAPTGWHLDAAAQGILVGILTTLLFTLPPLLAIRQIRPALILRRDMPDAKLPWRLRLRQSKESIVVALVLVGGLASIAAWLAESARVGAYFSAGLVVALLALGAVAWGLLRVIRVFLKRPPFRLTSVTRQGLSNLYRQGNQAQAILVAMSLGVMFTLSVYLIQSSVVDDIIATAPPGVPNVFLTGVTAEQVEPLKALVAEQAGVRAAAELGPAITAQLVKIDGRADWAPEDSPARRFSRPRTVSWEDGLPKTMETTQGKWWDTGAKDAVVSVNENAARVLELHPGQQLEFSIANRTVTARVLAIHRQTAFRATPDADFIFNRATLAGFPVVYYGGVRVEPSKAGAIQRAVFQKFPTVTVVNIADVLEIVQKVIDQIALVIRFLSAFAILAGAIILAASVAGTRFRRVREVVILKTLGATRSHIGRIFSIEFLTLGAVAGTMGALLAGGFTNLVLTQLLDTTFHINWTASFVCIALTALLANVAGWLASFRILGQKPLEVLREE
ncbi:MAG: FtsX-like permease family protein [Acidobacteriota bacterium]